MQIADAILRLRSDAARRLIRDAASGCARDPVGRGGDGRREQAERAERTMIKQTKGGLKVSTTVKGGKLSQKQA
jgi:hypothetical protein